MFGCGAQECRGAVGRRERVHIVVTFLEIDFKNEGLAWFSVLTDILHWDKHADPDFASRAKLWSQKLKDIHEWLAEIGIRRPAGASQPQRVTYHESCHLCHGQKVVGPPREVLKAIPGLELVELPESNWCCGSAGIYNITQPEMARKLLDRKLANFQRTNVSVVASANPGCSVQLAAGLRQANKDVRVVHPISLLAEAYRRTNRVGLIGNGGVPANHQSL